MQTNVTRSASTTLHTDRLPEDAARLILDLAQTAFAERGLFRLGLAGGNTPRAVYAELAVLGKDLPWEKIQITFGDERCVPPDHADSNYLMARESLLDLVPIPAGNVFRIRGEIDPEEAARDYEAHLAAFAARSGESRYVHDLLLLGIGEDGHTASLFPGSPALDETQRNVIPTIGPKPPPQRITFTLPLINASRQVCFLTKLKGKEEVIEGAIKGEQQYPSARVQPVNGSVTWMIGK